MASWRTPVSEGGRENDSTIQGPYRDRNDLCSTGSSAHRVGQKLCVCLAHSGMVLEMQLRSIRPNSCRRTASLNSHQHVQNSASTLSSQGHPAEHTLATCASTPATPLQDCLLRQVRRHLYPLSVEVLAGRRGYPAQSVSERLIGGCPAATSLH